MFYLMILIYCIRVVASYFNHNGIVAFDYNQQQLYHSKIELSDIAYYENFMFIKIMNIILRIGN